MISPLHAVPAFFYRHRLRGAITLHRWLAGGKPLKVRTKHGILLRLDPHEYVSSFVLKNGFYEEEVLDAILEGMGPGDEFWDIGSCLGLHALTVAKLRSIRVLAFEPNPAMARAIREARQENGVNVEVFEEALSDSTGPASLYLREGNAGMSSLSPDSGTVEIVVRKATGDSHASTGVPSVIKLDVEGHELEALKGMAKLLGDRRLRRIVFEDGPGESPVRRFLAGHGFDSRRIIRLEATHHGLENYVATRHVPSRLMTSVSTISPAR